MRPKQQPGARPHRDLGTGLLQKRPLLPCCTPMCPVGTEPTLPGLVLPISLATHIIKIQLKFTARPLGTRVCSEDLAWPQRTARNFTHRSHLRYLLNVWVTMEGEEVENTQS